MAIVQPVSGDAKAKIMHEHASVTFSCPSNRSRGDLLRLARYELLQLSCTSSINRYTNEMGAGGISSARDDWLSGLNDDLCHCESSIEIFVVAGPASWYSRFCFAENADNHVRESEREK